MAFLTYILKMFLMSRYKDISGQKFGRLTALHVLHNNHTNCTYWLSLCECGNLKEVRGTELRNG